MTIGIVGAGQLGRMLALAGYELGEQFLFLDRDASAPGGQVAPILTGEFTDRRLLAKLARRSDVLTFDWENVSLTSLRGLGRHTRICPPLSALAAAQDRLAEKRLFSRLGIPTTRHCAVDSRGALGRALRNIGLPGVLKTRRLGYDGRGQAVLRSADDADRAWALLGGVPLIYEEFVAFDCEVSIIGARSRRGEVAIYPLNLNQHREGILRVTRAPWHHAALQRRAAQYLRRVLRHFRYAGVLTIEFFVTRGCLIANEMAPRVHNSGHWTIEGAVTSQFENHVRAVLDLPLGSAAPRADCAMVNLIGALPERRRLLGQPDLHFHDYGKSARPGRKLGHVTLLDSDRRRLDRRVTTLLRQIGSDTRLESRFLT